MDYGFRLLVNLIIGALVYASAWLCFGFDFRPSGLLGAAMISAAVWHFIFSLVRLRQ